MARPAAARAASSSSSKALVRRGGDSLSPQFQTNSAGDEPSPPRKTKLDAALGGGHASTISRDESRPAGQNPAMPIRFHLRCAGLGRAACFLAAGLLAAVALGTEAFPPALPKVRVAPAGPGFITDAGKKVAARNPKVIDRDFLMQFPQFVQFAQTTGTKKAASHNGGDLDQGAAAAAKDKTPEWFRAKLRLAEIAMENKKPVEATNILNDILRSTHGVTDADVLEANAVFARAAAQISSADVQKQSGRRETR